MERKLGATSRTGAFTDPRFASGGGPGDLSVRSSESRRSQRLGQRGAGPLAPSTLDPSWRRRERCLRPPRLRRCGAGAARRSARCGRDAVPAARHRRCTRPAATTSRTVRYISETTATNAAAPTSEADPKPESTLAYGEVDEPVRKSRRICRSRVRCWTTRRTRAVISTRGCRCSFGLSKRISCCAAMALTRTCAAS
jgi:hypothetical protein